MLTDLEKGAGRWFRDQMNTRLAELNAGDPPGMVVPWVLHHVRHDCVARGGVSTSFEAREVYVPNPELWVCYCSAIRPFVSGSFPHEDCQGGKLALAGGRIAYVYREGRCACTLLGRSEVGDVVDATDRPPAGKVTPWQTTEQGAKSPGSGRTPSR
jgi:hypothetical protein